MLKNLKTRTVVIAVIAVMLAVASIVTVHAYLSDRENATNIFTYDENEIEIEESFSPPPSIGPGSRVPKVVQIRNTGKLDCWTRLDALITPESLSQYLTIDYNYDDWTYLDGKWYYNERLAPNEMTTPLFTEVTIRDDAPADAIKAFDIIINADSMLCGDYTDMWSAWAVWEATP